MNKNTWSGLSTHEIILVLLNESHEPLKTSTELAQGLLGDVFGELNDEQKRALEIILNRTERLTALLDSLKDGNIPS